MATLKIIKQTENNGDVWYSLKLNDEHVTDSMTQDYVEIKNKYDNFNLVTKEKIVITEKEI